MDKIDLLKAALLSSRPPYCAGTLSLEPEDLLIFYGKSDRKTHGHIDFNVTDDEQLRHLAETCDKATFGRNKEDVLDESYRKAGKLDSSNFCTKLDPERAGLIDIIRYYLLEGAASSKPIKVELYKLNIYGKDSFFKAHQDTPRGAKMFGSLVIVFPTPHEGGALILRHNSKEWTYDSGKEIGDTKKIGFVAFFSDVEHEVVPVKSRYRVTLTYNLYHINESKQRTLKPLSILPMNECAIKGALRAMVEDKTFYPKGTHLGFGLSHQYPVDLMSNGLDSLDSIYKNLKGSDAVLKQACEELGLNAELYVYYRTDRGDSNCDILVPRIVDIDEGVSLEDEDFGDYILKTEEGSKVIKGRNGRYSEVNVDLRVTWVTSTTRYNEQLAAWMAYGNEYYRKTTYGWFCLIVTLGPAEHRSTGLPIDDLLQDLRGF